MRGNVRNDLAIKTPVCVPLFPSPAAYRQVRPFVLFATQSGNVSVIVCDMRTFFWVRRFCMVLMGVFAVLFTVYLVRGRELGWAFREAAIWSGISSTVFLISGLYYSRRGRACMLCDGLPPSATRVEADKVVR
jgi:hypothetical protein